MALLVDYSDSDGSSVEESTATTTNDNNKSIDSRRKRTFSEMTKTDKSAVKEDADSDIESEDEMESISNQKKKRKMKALPSAKKALESKASASMINAVERDKMKQKQIELLMANSAKKSVSKEIGNGSDRKEDDELQKELKRNRIENAKYIKEQIQMLSEAQKEAKFKKLTQETTRQKNSRKQKLGQANFTLKWDRDCGHEMAGV